MYLSRYLDGIKIVKMILVRILSQTYPKMILSYKDNIDGLLEYLGNYIVIDYFNETN